MSAYVAIDLGAESGRIILGRLENNQLHLEEIHRFPNGPIEHQNSLRWNTNRIWKEILHGLSQAYSRCSSIESMGVNTWGVDFVLLDKQGNMLGSPYHYRDSRTDSIMEEVFRIIPKKELYQLTGIQTLQFNSLFQLMAFRKQHPELFNQIHRFLFMPDWINYQLTGKLYNEYTIASTSQMMDMRSGKYSERILKKLEIPGHIFPPIIQPGTFIGNLRPKIASRCGCATFPVIAVAAHDTASAVAGTPGASDSNWAYLSSGTWSLMGIETSDVVINEQTNSLQLTNEGGVEGTIRLLKNIMGLWLVQECRRDWEKQGNAYSYSELTELAELAEKTQPFAAFINVEDQAFFSPGNMDDRLRDYLFKTGQQNDFNHGQMIRIILEGMAYRYSEILHQIEKVAGNEIEVLHVVGGGSQNQLLNQLTADATGKKVISGPIEATICGNVLMQALAQHKIDSLNQIRSIIRKSFDFTMYFPCEHEVWQEMRQNYHKIYSH